MLSLCSLSPHSVLALLSAPKSPLQSRAASAAAARSRGASSCECLRQSLVVSLYLLLLHLLLLYLLLLHLLLLHPLLLHLLLLHLLLLHLLLLHLLLLHLLLLYLLLLCPLPTLVLCAPCPSAQHHSAEGLKRGDIAASANEGVQLQGMEEGNGSAMLRATV